MSKTIINIKSLTINVTAGAGASAGISPSLIGMLIHRAISEAGANVGGDPETTGTGETGDTHATETTAAADTATIKPTATAEGIVAFLTSDARYTLRSYDAIEKNFAAVGSLTADLLDNLVDGGVIGTKHQRGTSKTLYYVLDASLLNTPTEAPAAEAPAETPALTVENVRQFLQSDERYTQRSVDSVAKFFNVSHDEAADKLEEMDDNGDARRTTRRSDGAALYQVA